MVIINRLTRVMNRSIKKNIMYINIFLRFSDKNNHQG